MGGSAWSDDDEVGKYISQSMLIPSETVSPAKLLPPKPREQVRTIGPTRFTLKHVCQRSQTGNEN
jgi:hypothetical protein